MSSTFQRTCLALACTLPSCCVAATTRVRTPRGDVPAGWLGVGDLVHSVDVTTGELLVATVVQVRRATRECVALHWQGGALVCTPDHPLYSPETATYRPASDWVTGPARTLLHVTPAGARPVAVTATDAFVGVHEVLDLTLDRAPHNFLAADVVVHNKSPVEYFASAAADGPAITLGADDTAEYRARICLHGEDTTLDTLSMHVKADETVAPSESFFQLTVTLAGSESTTHVPDDDDYYGSSSANSCTGGVPIAFKAFRNDGGMDGEISVSFTLQASAQASEGDENDPDALTIVIDEV